MHLLTRSTFRLEMGSPDWIDVRICLRRARRPHLARPSPCAHGVAHVNLGSDWQKSTRRLTNYSFCGRKKLRVAAGCWHPKTSFIGGNETPT